MGGLLHLFDFHQGHIRRKHKKKGDGMFPALAHK